MTSPACVRSLITVVRHWCPLTPPPVLCDVYLCFSFFEKGTTAYVFTADHGMSARGSHGDGHPDNTRTPIVAWGAGIAGPKPTHSAFGIADHLYSQKLLDIMSAEHPPLHQELVNGLLRDLLHERNYYIDKATGWSKVKEAEVTEEWGMQEVYRRDVLQADIAPLLASVIGAPVPLNSMGMLPTTYLGDASYRSRAILANAWQMWRQVDKLAADRKSRSTFYRSYDHLDHTLMLLRVADSYVQSGGWEKADLCAQLAVILAKRALAYFQTYDSMLLFGASACSFLAWTSLLLTTGFMSVLFDGPAKWIKPRLPATAARNGESAHFLSIARLLYTILAVAAAGLGAYLWFQSAPITYYLYVLPAPVFAAQCISNLQHIIPTGILRKGYLHIGQPRMLGLFVTTVLLLVLLARGFSTREFFGLLIAAQAVNVFIPVQTVIPVTGTSSVQRHWVDPKVARPQLSKWAVIWAAAGLISASFTLFPVGTIFAAVRCFIGASSHPRNPVQ